jgi:hypothetical protein
LDGRRDRDECAKPIVGCGTGPAVGPVAVFSLVRFQEKEMRKAARRKYAEKVWQSGHYDVGPLGPTPAQAGMLLRRGWFGRLREGFVPNVEMLGRGKGNILQRTFRYSAECRNVMGNPANVLG